MSTPPDERRDPSRILRSIARAAAAILAVAVALCPPARASLGEIGEGAAQADGLYLNWIDRRGAPGKDFFAFANGGWIKSHPIPADRAYWGVDTLLEQQNQIFIRNLIESLTREDWPDGTPQRKIADFYASGMDERAIEAAGAAPLAPEFARIAAISSREQLPQAFAHLQSIGVEAPIVIGQMQDFADSTRVIAVASQSGLGLPNRDYYLKDEPAFKAARTAYIAHIARMLVLLGDTAPAAAAESKAVVALETRLAQASMSDVEQREPHAIYHPMTLEALHAIAPHLDVEQMLPELKIPQIDSLNAGMPEFLKAVDREIANTSLADWKAYLRWQLLDAYAPYLSAPFAGEDFRMTAELTGAEELQERWLRVLKAEDDALGFAIGQLYVARKFPTAWKEAAVALVGRIRDALHDDLGTLSWMSPATRAAAQQKLDLMQLRIGYPDQWRDYAGLVIDRGPYVLNVMRANAFEVQRQLAKIGKPVDRSEWYMTPQTVNAYYDPSMNSLTVPAGILQPPYFDPNFSDTVNFGATGVTVGHEMTHGFDDEGAQFDGYGNLKNWWAPQDLARFHAATQCIAEQYSRYTVGAGMHVQGALVTGEATADLGGLVLAWRALHAASPAAPAHPVVAAEFTPDQQFFIAFAHSWASVTRPKQAEKMVTTDPHPPAEDRTNASLANSPDFQTVFGISAPSPMVKAHRCIIW
ncbi:MAG: M13 family metallopeptidase [Steroidobacteraceae bacterium]